MPKQNEISRCPAQTPTTKQLQEDQEWWGQTEVEDELCAILTCLDLIDHKRRQRAIEYTTVDDVVYGFRCEFVLAPWSPEEIDEAWRIHHAEVVGAAQSGSITCIQCPLASLHGVGQRNRSGMQ